MVARRSFFLVSECVLFPFHQAQNVASVSIDNQKRDEQAEAAEGPVFGIEGMLEHGQFDDCEQHGC